MKASKIALVGMLTGLLLFVSVPALGNWPGYYNYIGHGDGDIIAGRKDQRSSSNAYNVFEGRSQAGSVFFWVDHYGSAKTAQYKMSKGSVRHMPYKNAQWSGPAMLRARLDAWIAFDEQMVRGSINFDDKG